MNKYKLVYAVSYLLVFAAIMVYIGWYAMHHGLFGVHFF